MTTLVSHVVTNRHVFTYERDGMPAGVVTGYDNGVGGFVVEHLIAWKQGALWGLMREGLDRAWLDGYEYVLFAVPTAWEQTPRLISLGHHLGFTLYHEADEFSYFVRYR